LDAKQLVAISRASGNPPQLIINVGVQQTVAPDGPSPGEFGHQLCFQPHLARESAISLEMVTTALGFVGVPPLANQGVFSIRWEACAGRQQTGNEDKRDFHPAGAGELINCASRKRNR
jgi:hypothetical protein